MAHCDDTALTFRSVTERVLTGTFNGAVRLDNGEPLDASPRSTVYRYAARPPRRPPSS